MHLAATNSLALNANDKKRRNFEKWKAREKTLHARPIFPAEERTDVSEAEASSSPEEHQTWTDDHFEKPTNFT